jgi:hypothetical protein
MTQAEASAEPVWETQNVDAQATQLLVYDYLVHECYPETAKAFAKACQLSVDRDGDTSMGDSNIPHASVYSKQSAILTLDARRKIVSLVSSGKIQEAIKQTQQAFPDALAGRTPGGTDLSFELACQHFIELVRMSAGDALNFAQEGKFFTIHV